MMPLKNIGIESVISTNKAEKFTVHVKFNLICEPLLNILASTIILP